MKARDMLKKGFSVNVSFSIKVYAVVIQGDNILATLHDRGLGAFWGLPGEWVAPDNALTWTVEAAVQEQCSHEVVAGDLLCIEHFHNASNMFRAEIYMALICKAGTLSIPKLSKDASPSDGSIVDTAWVDIQEFMSFPSPELERNFWNRSIKAHRYRQQHSSVDVLHEVDLNLYQQNRHSKPDE